MLSLLIVDDDARMRSLIRSIVADLVDSVRECGDGSNAMAVYAEQHPDWVFMDLAMQQVGGIKATRQLLASYPEARVVIVTDYESPALREAAETAGACGYVLKENLEDLRKLFTTSQAPEPWATR